MTRPPARSRDRRAIRTTEGLHQQTLANVTLREDALRQKGEAKYTPVSIRLHPHVIAWAKREAKKRHLGYQTIINEVLLKAFA